MIEEAINKIEEKIGRFAENIESAILGRGKYNLEIDMEKNSSQVDEKKLWNIERYTGSFIVTEKGYLINGYDNKLDKEHAKIYAACQILPPFIFYESGRVDKIMETFLGLRLASFAYKPKIENNICFA